MSVTRRITSSLAAAALALPMVAFAVPAVAAPSISFVDRGWPGQPFGGQPYGNPFGQTTAINATQATAEQSVGVVQISRVVDFDGGEAAGTGIVIDASATGGGALVVTNHHVVEEATSIEVTDPITGEVAEAGVPGFDAVKDVAVLRVDSTTLTAVDTDTSGVDVGDPVVAVGDAGGDGGSLTAAEGTVTALRQQIDGYVISMRRVLKVVDKVLAGDDTGPITLGYSAFLGVGLSTSGGAAVVGNLVEGGPAADAGIGAGSTVTTFDGIDVKSSTHLRRLIQQHEPGEQVVVTWTGAQGGSHDAALTLDRAPVARSSD